MPNLIQLTLLNAYLNDKQIIWQHLKFYPRKTDSSSYFAIQIEKWSIVVLSGPNAA